MTVVRVFIGLLIAAVLLSFAWTTIRDLRRRRHARLDKLIMAARADRERLFPGTGNDKFGDKPCSHEDQWCNGTCDQPLIERIGKHHALQHIPPHQYVKWDHCDRCYATFEITCNAPSYGPEPVIGYCEWSEDMNRRYAE